MHMRTDGAMWVSMAYGYWYLKIRFLPTCPIHVGTGVSVRRMCMRVSCLIAIYAHACQLMLDGAEGIVTNGMILNLCRLSNHYALTLDGQWRHELALSHSIRYWLTFDSFTIILFDWTECQRLFHHLSLRERTKHFVLRPSVEKLLRVLQFLAINYFVTSSNVSLPLLVILLAISLSVCNMFAFILQL